MIDLLTAAQAFRRMVERAQPVEQESVFFATPEWRELCEILNRYEGDEQLRTIPYPPIQEPPAMTQPEPKEQ